MTRREKAILALICAAEIINCAKVGVLKSRIADLETQRDIYASRAQHWIDRAVEDEEVIDSMQLRLDALADGKVELEDAGVFFCTAYCTEQYPHICGEGHGITASGQPIQAGVTVAADQTIFPYGTVLYIEGVGIRIVQDKGAGVQGTHIDVAVDTHENALAWSGYGEHQVWILKGEYTVAGCSLTLWPSRGAGISSSISPQTRRQRSKRGRVLQNRKDEEHGKIYAAC